ENFKVVGNSLVLDTLATLHNAYNEVQIRRMKNAQVETAEQRATAQAKAERLKSQATISGEGAASQEDPMNDPTLAKLLMDPNTDYNDIIRHPAYQRFIDPKDPPRGI